MKKHAVSKLSMRLLLLWLTLSAASLSLLPSSCAATVRAYKLLDKPGGRVAYTLTVTVQQSLYEYYASKSHLLASVSGFPKFVTPYAVKPIADRLREIYSGDEEFANAVLTIVHQIPYSESDPKYPVEAIYENAGDCDVFSCLAASIMIAGGLDTVLIYYEEKSHMNIAVSLPQTPKNARETVYYVIYNGLKYYLGECTGENWISGWRIGECPPELEQPLKTAKVIALKNLEQTAPAQVSAGFTAVKASSLTLNASAALMIQGATLKLSGKLSPPLSNEQITLYIQFLGGEWKLLGIATTSLSGEFLYAYDADAMGICLIRASWSGSSGYAGADSQTVNVIVLPQYLLMLIIGAAALAVFGLAASTVKRPRLEELDEPELPPIQLPPI